MLKAKPCSRLLFPLVFQWGVKVHLGLWLLERWCLFCVYVGGCVFEWSGDTKDIPFYTISCSNLSQTCSTLNPQCVHNMDNITYLGARQGLHAGHTHRHTHTDTHTHTHTQHIFTHMYMCTHLGPLTNVTTYGKNK